MGGGGGVVGAKGVKGAKTTAPTRGATAPSPTPTTQEFEANSPQIMPVYNSPAQIESARRKRQELMARSGRTSTNLTGNPGTQSYMNSFLGSVA
jgi:hypothetical protein